MKIGNVEINSLLALAPMAGVTDAAYRQICSELGAGLTYSELVSAKALCYQDKKSRLLLQPFEGEQPYALVSTEAGQKVAQVMLVVGSDLGGAEHPNWKENLAFAAFLQRGTMKRCTSLARPLCLRGSRFNQQATPCSLLVEVGGHGNTLRQAIDGGRLFAAGMARSLQELAPLP